MHFKFHFILISQKGQNFRLLSGSFTVPLSVWKHFGGEKAEPPEFFQFSCRTVATHDPKNQMRQENQEEVVVSKHSQHDLMQLLISRSIRKHAAYWKVDWKPCITSLSKIRKRTDSTATAF